MAVIYEEKESNLLAGYPVRTSKFKDGEYLTFDIIGKKWIAQQQINGDDIRLGYTGSNVTTITTYMKGKLVGLTTLTWDGDKVTTIVKEDYLKEKIETITLVYSGSDVIQIIKR